MTDNEFGTASSRPETAMEDYDFLYEATRGAVSDFLLDEMPLTIIRSRWGLIDVPETSIITFSKGIIGFEDKSRFALVAMPEYQPFQCLIAADGSDVSFVLADPNVFFENYSPTVFSSDFAEICLETRNNLLTYCILTLGARPEDTTMNLRGPVIINGAKRLGKQIIVGDEAYDTRHPLTQFEKVTKQV